MAIAGWGCRPFYGRFRLAHYAPRGYVAPSARLTHDRLRLGEHTFIGDRVTIYDDRGGGPVHLQSHVRLTADIYIQTGQGGAVSIGERTAVQPRCHFSAYLASITIGREAMIAPNCAFYPYDHGTAPGQPIASQPFVTKGDITVGDGAWLGVGVTVLSGVRIGSGAVVGAGSVVTRDVPDGGIAMGVPARVTGNRAEDSQPDRSSSRR